MLWNLCRWSRTQRCIWSSINLKEHTSSFCSLSSTGYPLAARIKFKSLMLACKVLNGTAPIYLNALAKAYITTRSLRSSKGCRLAVPTPRSRQSRLFMCCSTMVQWPTSATRTGASLSIFNKLLKRVQRTSLILTLTLFPTPSTALSVLPSIPALYFYCHLWQSIDRKN